MLLKTLLLLFSFEKLQLWRIMILLTYLGSFIRILSLQRLDNSLNVPNKFIIHLISVLFGLFLAHFIWNFDEFYVSYLREITLLSFYLNNFSFLLTWLTEEFEAQADARKKAFSNKNQSQSSKHQQNSNGRGRENVGVRFEDVATVVWVAPHLVNFIQQSRHEISEVPTLLSLLFSILFL